MNERLFLSELATALEEAPESLSFATELDGLASWDSLGHLSCIAFFDEHCERHVSAEQLRACHTVADLAALAGNVVTA